MKLDTSEESLAVYEALASKIRLQIIRLLADNALNIKELAEKLGLSSAIVTMHIKKLEKARLITTERIPGKSGTQKISRLAVNDAIINFPKSRQIDEQWHESIVPIGQYVDFSVTPSCGLATDTAYIGKFDDPRYFLDAQRVNAGILWFTQGYMEYKIPNFLKSNQTPDLLEISFEIASEFPSYKENWPSDITFSINQIEVGTWTSPGDFGGTKGKFTPDWWPEAINQYGLLKNLRIDQEETRMNDEILSSVSLKNLDIHREFLTLRIAVNETAKNVGGCTLFGSGFGNYAQDILSKLYYH